MVSWTDVILLLLFIIYSTIIAHAGDGNFHTIILFDPSKEEERQEAERLNHFMVHTALAMDGTQAFCGNFTFIPFHFSFLRLYLFIQSAKIHDYWNSFFFIVELVLMLKLLPV